MQHEECLNYSAQKRHAETGIFFLIFQVHNVSKLDMLNGGGGNQPSMKKEHEKI